MDSALYNCNSHLHYCNLAEMPTFWHIWVKDIKCQQDYRTIRYFWLSNILFLWRNFLWLIIIFVTPTMTSTNCTQTRTKCAEIAEKHNSMNWNFFRTVGIIFDCIILEFVIIGCFIFHTQKQTWQISAWFFVDCYVVILIIVIVVSVLNNIIIIVAIISRYGGIVFVGCCIVLLVVNVIIIHFRSIWIFLILFMCFHCLCSHSSPHIHLQPWQHQQVENWSIMTVFLLLSLPKLRHVSKSKMILDLKLFCRQNFNFLFLVWNEIHTPSIALIWCWLTMVKIEFV